MTHWLSEPFESISERLDARPATDVLIVGSGYGAAMAALALTTGKEVPHIRVLERGEEYVPGDFPRNIGDFPRHVSAITPTKRYGRRNALYELRMRGGNADDGRHGVGALVGSGLGGGSLVNANVALRPGREALDRWPARPDGTAWHDLLAPHVDAVESLLGVTTDGKLDDLATGEPRNDGTRDRLRRLDRFAALSRFAERAQAAPAFLAPLTVSFRAGDNAAGIHQPACIHCGNCVTGCNIGAKNSLNLNAWAIAKQRGIEIFTGTTVRLLERMADGTWSVHVHATTAPHRTETLRAHTVIIAAGAFGSTEVLKRTQPKAHSVFLPGSGTVSPRTVTASSPGTDRRNASAPSPQNLRSPRNRGKAETQTDRVRGLSRTGAWARAWSA